MRDSPRRTAGCSPREGKGGADLEGRPVAGLTEGNGGAVLERSAGCSPQGRGKARLTSEVTALSWRGMEDSIRAAPVPLEETTVPRSSPLPVTRRTQTDVASSRGTVATRSASRSSWRVTGAPLTTVVTSAVLLPPVLTRWRVRPTLPIGEKAAPPTSSTPVAAGDQEISPGIRPFPIRTNAD